MRIDKECIPDLQGHIQLATDKCPCPVNKILVIKHLHYLCPKTVHQCFSCHIRVDASRPEVKHFFIAQITHSAPVSTLDIICYDLKVRFDVNSSFGFQQKAPAELPSICSLCCPVDLQQQKNPMLKMC
jgi:hypothetical protein